MGILFTQASTGTALPPAERDAFLQAGVEAETFAAGGKVASGFMRLAHGLQRARNAETAGIDWGEALVRLYRVAMAAYAHRHCLWSSECADDRPLLT